MLTSRLPRTLARTGVWKQRRFVTSLSNNPHIYVHPNPQSPAGPAVLSYLPSSPPNLRLAIGTTTEEPPTPESFIENSGFLDLLQTVIAEHATQDPDVQAQAKAFASTGGSNLGSGGAFFPQQRTSKRGAVGGGGGAGGSGAGGASAQGGMGGANVGGWVHVSDQRNPPDWGRIAYPEDILGSLQVNGEGDFVGVNGSYQRSGTYRIITRDGLLGLSPFLRDRLVERLQQLEKKP